MQQKKQETIAATTDSKNQQIISAICFVYSIQDIFRNELLIYIRIQRPTAIGKEKLHAAIRKEDNITELNQSYKAKQRTKTSEKLGIT